MLDYSYDLVFRAAMDGSVVYTNRSFREAMKLDSCPSGKRKVESFFVLESRDELQSCMETSQSGIPLKGAMLTLQTCEGKRLPIEASFVPETGQDTVLAFCRSIREQEAAREAVKESERQLLTVLSNLPDLLMVIDRSGKYRQIYTADESMLVRPAEELLGKRVPEVMPARDAATGMAIIEKVIATRQSVETEYELDVQGNRIWFSAKVVPFTEGRGPLRFMGIQRH